MDKEKERHIKYSNYFVTATFVGVFILISSVVCCTFLVRNTLIETSKNQAKIEFILTQISDKNQKIDKLIVKNNDNYNNFLMNYYSVQSNWLNVWLAALAIIMAVLGVMIPICFVKFLENKEKEMDRIIEDANKQKEDMQLQVNEVNEKYDEITSKANYVDKKSEQMSKELEEVKDYVNTAKAESKYAEARTEFMKHNYDEAIKILYQVKYSKNTAKICSLLANCFYKKNYINKALELAVEGLALKKNDIECLFQCALCHYRRNQMREALKDINLLIKLEPKNDFHKIDKMKILLSIDKSSNEEEARKLLLNLREQYRDFNWAILDSLAILAYKLDDFDLSKELLLKSISKDRYPYYQYYTLTKVYVKLGLYKQALNSLQKYIKNDLKDENLGIYDVDKEEWIAKITSVEQTDDAYNLLMYIQKLKVSRKLGDGVED